MRRRLAQAEKNGKLEPPPWVAAPVHTPLGFPVDWLAGFSRIVLGDAVDRPLLAANPGCFWAACGLALQGVGRSHVQLELPLIERPSAIEKVAGIFRPAVLAAWGIDVGSSCVKAVKLAWRKKQNAVVLEVAARVEYKKPLGQAANEEEEQSIVEEALTALVSQYPLKADKVCLGLPGRVVLMRLFEIPRTDRAKMSAMVQFEAKRHIPTRLEHLAWDFQPLGGEEDGDGTARHDGNRGASPVLFAATRWDALNARLELMQRAGIRVHAVQSECIALHNYLMFERGVEHQSAKLGKRPKPKDPKAAEPTSPPPPPAWPVAIVNIGGDGGNLVVSSPTGIWIRHLGFGGYSINRALVKQFQLTAAQAEQWKRNPTEAPNLSAFFATLEPVMEDFVRELGVSLAAYGKSDHYRPVRQMLGLGGGFPIARPIGLPAVEDRLLISYRRRRGS